MIIVNRLTRHYFLFQPQSASSEEKVLNGSLTPIPLQELQERADSCHCRGHIWILAHLLPEILDQLWRQTGPTGLFNKSLSRTWAFRWIHTWLSFELLTQHGLKAMNQSMKRKLDLYWQWTSYDFNQMNITSHTSCQQVHTYLLHPSWTLLSCMFANPSVWRKNIN